MQPMIMCWLTGECLQQTTGRLDSSAVEVDAGGGRCVSHKVQQKDATSREDFVVVGRHTRQQPNTTALSHVHSLCTKERGPAR